MRRHIETFQTKNSILNASWRENTVWLKGNKYHLAQIPNFAAG